MTHRSWLARTPVAAALVVGTILVVPAAPASAADNGTWAATPTVAEQQAPRQYFFMDLSDGQSIEDSITITNYTDEVKRLDIFPADAYNVSDGAGFAVTDFGQETDDVGSWITLSRKAVFVPKATVDKDGEPKPGEVKVPFTLTVPKGAAPGDHAGAVVTMEEAPAATGDSAQLRVRRQLAVRTYVRVAGPLTTSLSIDSVKLTAEPARLPFIGRQGGAYVEYVVRNTGNTRVSPDRVVELTGLFGRNLHTSPVGVTPEILPGSTVTLAEAFVGMPALDLVTARVVLSDQEGEELAAGDTSSWVISIPFLVLLFLIILAILLGIRFGPLRKRRQAAAAQEAEAALVTSEPV